MILNFQQAENFSKRDMVRTMLNAFKTSWLPEDEKQAYIDVLKEWPAQRYVNI